MLRKRLLLWVLLALGSLPTAACNRGDSSEIGVAIIGLPGDPFDKAVRLSPAGMLVRSSTVEGLVAFDEAGRVIPALADRWIVTDDGQSYIFRLRDGTWATGDPITADSARHALNSALKSVRGSPFAADLAGIDEVRTMAGRVIEIRLSRPMPYLLQLLAQPELGLYRKGRGAGPMKLSESGGAAIFSAIDPEELGQPAVEDWKDRTRQVRLQSLLGPQSVAKFNDGTVDLVLGGRIQDFLLTRSVGILRGTIQLDPVVGLFGLRVMSDRGFLGDRANREALAMAVDRDSLLAPFGVGGWTPTTRIVTPSLDGDLGTIGERWADQTIDQRRATAVARVRAWHSRSEPGNGAAPITLSIWLPEGDGAAVLFGRLRADFGDIGVQLERSSRIEGADLAMVDEVARYPRAGWYLNWLRCGMNAGLCSPAADRLIDEASATADVQQRAALLAQAEGELTNANVFIPFGPPIRWSLVRGSVSGFSPNPWGWHPLMPLAWLPK